MLIKAIKDEDFINYKKPSMFIAASRCDWKCCVEQNYDKSICQNSTLAQQKNYNISVDEIFNRYISNPITNSIVIGGLEPMLQFNDIIELIDYFRKNRCNDDIIIYTGYYENEILNYIKTLQSYNNIIIKYGRYIMNKESVFDKTLGVTLASNNQYAVKIS